MRVGELCFWISKEAAEGAIQSKDTVTVMCELRWHSVRARIYGLSCFVCLILFHNSLTSHWHVELNQRYTVSVPITYGM